ncbi:hypothetical protein Tco_0609421 [Tanacetum coccineum]
MKHPSTTTISLSYRHQPTPPVPLVSTFNNNQKFVWDGLLINLNVSYTSWLEISVVVLMAVKVAVPPVKVEKLQEEKKCSRISGKKFSGGGVVGDVMVVVLAAVDVGSSWFFYIHAFFIVYVPQGLFGAASKSFRIENQ